MKLSQVAAQLYTLRDFCKTPADTAAALRKVRAIGYQAVQVSGVCDMPESELNRMLSDAGLACCATHEPSERILKEPQAIVERLEKLNCRYTAYAYPSGIDFGSRQKVTEFIAQLDAAGSVLNKAGKVLAYHNHALEFVRMEGKPILQKIFDESRPDHLQGELDTYWVQYGGGNPVQWCGYLKKRLPLLHAKDYGFTIENKPCFAEIGRGNLDFRAIVKAAESAGMEWFIVEQDVCPGDPFESLKINFDYIRQNLVS